MFDQSERYFDQDDDKPDLPKEWITKNLDFLPHQMPEILREDS